jgi:hypothetical protein
VNHEQKVSVEMIHPQLGWINEAVVEIVTEIATTLVPSIAIADPQ